MANADPFSTADTFSPLKILTFPEVLSAVQAGAPVRPINMEINPTNTCNESCTWCTYGYLHERKEALPPEVLLALLHDAREMGVQSVTWTGGGEPTVYRELGDMIGVAAGLGFRQGLNSNGTLFNERLRTLAVDHLSYVRFSVDAGTAETYARTHRIRPEMYDRVTGNIAALARQRDEAGSRLTIGFSFLVDASNVADLATAAALARDIGVDYFQIKPIVNYVESNLQFAEHSILWNQMEAQMPDVFALENEKFRVYFLGHKFKDIKLQNQHYGRSYDVCRGNELLVSVGADGSVDLCCAFKGDPNWSFGNLNEKSFRDIWEGEQRRRVMGSVDVKKCPPLCKAHEMNKVFHYIRNFDAHREFV